MQNKYFSKYWNSDSKVHNMNPICKILCCLFFIIMTFQTTQPVLFVLLIVFTILYFLLTHIPFSVYRKTFWNLRYFLLLFLLTSFLFHTSLLHSLLIMVRLFLIVGYTSILTMTTPTLEVSYALAKLLSPLRIFHIPINQYAFMVSLTISFIPMLYYQANRILKAQASRGMDYNRGTLKSKVYVIKNMLIALFSLSLKQADTLSDIMEIRLYDVEQLHSNFRTKPWRFFDTYMIVLHCAMLVLFTMKG